MAITACLLHIAELLCILKLALDGAFHLARNCLFDSLLPCHAWQAMDAHITLCSTKANAAVEMKPDHVNILDGIPGDGSDSVPGQRFWLITCPKLVVGYTKRRSMGVRLGHHLCTHNVGSRRIAASFEKERVQAGLSTWTCTSKRSGPCFASHGSSSLVST